VVDFPDASTLIHFFWWRASLFRSRHDFVFEIIALRQQLVVLKGKSPGPRLSQWNRLFWIALRRFWTRWARR
jgi:hypothetical protein